MQLDKNILRQRIAASKLYKYLPGIYIQLAKNKYYNLLISNQSEGFAFGAKVGSTKMLQSNDFKEYFRVLSMANMEEIKYPIVAISVNENSEDVKMGMLTKIRLLRPKFFRNPRMVSVNENSVAILYDNIKSMDNVIRNLNSDNWGVIKKINISIYRNDGFTAKAYVMYLRPFGEDYKCQPDISDEKEKFERYVYGIPQDEYPSDIIDEVIEGGIATIYPGAEIVQQSSLFLFNTDLDNLRRTTETHGRPKNISFRIEPNIDEEIKTSGYFSSILIDLKLYPENALLNDFWQDRMELILLDLGRWMNFLDIYKSNLQLKTDISQIIL